MTAIEILQTLRDMPRLTPTLIGRKMKRPPSVIRNVLVILVELGLVAPAARGLYELTPDGKDLLERIEKREEEKAPERRKVPIFNR